MVNYRVHYDDSLGTSPDITGVAELVVRRKGHDVPDASLVMIRISNEGGLDIGREHWVLPISFTFDGRDVVGVEVEQVVPGRLERRLALLDRREPDRLDRVDPERLDDRLPAVHDLEHTRAIGARRGAPSRGASTPRRP